MDEQFFAGRLHALRAQKGVTAREMSLALGQNPSYINRIENRLAYPSMQVFFFICDYLGVTPAEFFDERNAAPRQRQELDDALDRLDAKQRALVEALIHGLLDR